MLIDEQNLLLSEDKSDNYLSRCIQELKQWNAPLSDWVCVDVVDVCDDDPDAPLTKCEVCGCEKVRYLHVMEHEDFFMDLNVGCICAGVMEDDILRAKERDRRMKNRAKRKRNFIKKKLVQINHRVMQLKHKGCVYQIIESNGGYAVQSENSYVRTYKNKPISNMLTAMYAAFDLADPISEVMNF